MSKSFSVCDLPPALLTIHLAAFAAVTTLAWMIVLPIGVLGFTAQCGHRFARTLLRRALGPFAGFFFLLLGHVLALTILLLALLPMPLAVFAATTLYEQGGIKVTENTVDDTRDLWIAEAWQGSMRIGKPLDGLFPYAHDSLQAPARRVLVLGLGTGMIPKLWLARRPEAQLDVVEIEPTMPWIAEHFFGLPRSDRLRIIITDAIEYVRVTDQRYDFISVDLYGHEGEGPIPAETEPAFLADVRRCLTPNGVVQVTPYMPEVRKAYLLSVLRTLFPVLRPTDTTIWACLRPEVPCVP